MTVTTARAHLTELLSRERAAILELSAALSAEQQALRAGDSDALGRSSADKQHCVDRLNTLENERRELCAALGLAPDRFGMEHLLERCDKDGKLVALWSELRATLENCRRANSANGAAVATRQRQVRHLLGVLAGHPVDAPLYDAGGALDTDTPAALHTHA